MTDLTPLIARVEAASGADRELDARIWCVVSPAVETYTTDSWMRNEPRPAMQDVVGLALADWLDRYPDDAAKMADSYGVPKFSSSLDAAMLLVPEGCEWMVDNFSGNGIKNCCSADVFKGENRGHCAGAATPALALVAACLKARAV